MKTFARLLALAVMLAGLVVSDGWAVPTARSAPHAATPDLGREREVAALTILAEDREVDIRQLAEKLETAKKRADKLGVSSDPAGAFDTTAGWYAGLPADLEVSLYDDLAGKFTTALAVLESRVAAKQRVLSLAGQAQDLLGQAEWQGTQKPGDEAAVSAATSAAKQARDDAEITAAIQQLQPLVARLAKEANTEPTLPLPNGPCLTGAPPKLIWVHLATQQLIAYANGCPVLATLVTTGRPALPTGQGVFHIFYKARWYLMHSPWPYGSPYWYPDTWVGDAMEFIGDGTFIHTADWEPPAGYGKGSQYGPYASHGCVHVMDGPAAQLFAWAPIGTEVIVGN